MSINLLLVLIGIAGLGVLSLILIVLGGAKKKKAKSKAKNKQLTEQTTAKSFSKTTSFSSHQHKEPIVSESATSFHLTQEIDPALTDLGFNALDDLLSDEMNGAMANASPKPAVFKGATKVKNSAMDILTLHIMAPDERLFIGYELLQAVTSAGLRFGKMNIFHYPATNDPNQSLFSLCSAVEPGYFDLDNIGALTCPGLSLFMRISATENPEGVFNVMLETAQQLATDLSGTLYDHEHKPLSDEQLQSYAHLISKHS